MAEVLWYRRETRRQTENTNICLTGGEAPAYSPVLPFAPGELSLGHGPPAKPLAEYAALYADRDAAIAAAYASGGYTLKEIGEYFGLHYAWISRIVGRAREEKDKTFLLERLRRRQYGVVQNHRNKS